MENNEDWDELNRWNEEKSKQEQTEFLNRNKPHKGMKEKAAEDREFIDSIAQTVHKTKSFGNFYIMNAKSIRTLFVAIFGCIVMVVAYYITLPNPEQKIKKAYGDKYVVASIQEIKKDSKLYTFSSKEAPDFQFHANLRGRNFQEDHRLSQVKYFFEHLDKSLQDKFEIKEQHENGLLTKYEIYRIVNEIEEVDKAIEEAYKIRNLGKDVLIRNINGYIDETHIHIMTNGEIIHETRNMNLAEAKDTARNNFIRVKRKNGEWFNADLSQTATQSILQVCVNGKPVITKDEKGEEKPMTATYRKDGYQFHFCKEFFEAISGAEFIDDYHFTYYGVQYEIGRPNAQNNLGFYEEDIQKVFSATFEYDDINGKVNIRIP